MPLLDPYIKAKYTTYWEFPTSVERLAATVTASEIGRVAWQKDNNTWWILEDAVPTWISLSPFKGVATLDFGAIGSVSNEASVVVPAAGVLSSSTIMAMMSLEATPEHPIQELLADPIQIFVGEINLNVSFTIYGKMPYGNAYGTYKVNYLVF